jgi:hypothetical protein
VLAVQCLAVAVVLLLRLVAQGQTVVALERNGVQVLPVLLAQPILVVAVVVAVISAVQLQHSQVALAVLVSLSFATLERRLVDNGSLGKN